MFVRQVSQEKQCEWLKKQHKKHAIKWHPDKCKGNMQACTLHESFPPLQRRCPAHTRHPKRVRGWEMPAESMRF